MDDPVDINGTPSVICTDCDGDGVHVLAVALPDQPRPATEGAVWVRFRDLYRLERLCAQCQGTGWEANPAGGPKCGRDDRGRADRRDHHPWAGPGSRSTSRQQTT